MTNEKNSIIMAPANPVKTVAPEKEETEMLRATEKSQHYIAVCLRKMKDLASRCPSKTRNASSKHMQRSIVF